MNNLFQERGTQTHGTSQHYFFFFFFFFAKQTVKVRPVPRQCHTHTTHPTKLWQSNQIKKSASSLNRASWGEKLLANANEKREYSPFSSRLLQLRNLNNRGQSSGQPVAGVWKQKSAQIKNRSKQN